MADVTAVETTETVADLLGRLGGIHAQRVLLRPAPGTAREEDLLYAHVHLGRLCELVDGVLVEKAIGYFESLLAGVLIQLLRNFLDRQPLGIVAGPDGMMRLTQGLVRIPDISFVSWGRLPGHRVPHEPIPHLAPDLAVEVISEGNTPAEMRRKVAEYFAAGVRLVWLVYPETRTAEVFTAPDRMLRIGEDGTLDGGDVIAGFALSMREWFARADPRPDVQPPR